jgi:hypothetical protein
MPILPIRPIQVFASANQSKDSSNVNDAQANADSAAQVKAAHTRRRLKQAEDYCKRNMSHPDF